jgi:transposase
MVGGVIPDIERQSAQEARTESRKTAWLLIRWRDEAIRVGRKITRVVLAFEAGRDGFWLAHSLRARRS